MDGGTCLSLMVPGPHYAWCPQDIRWKRPESIGFPEAHKCSWRKELGIQFDLRWFVIILKWVCLPAAKRSSQGNRRVRGASDMAAGDTMLGRGFLEEEAAAGIRGEVNDLSPRYLGIPAAESFYCNPEPDYGSLHARFDRARARRLRKSGDATE